MITIYQKGMSAYLESKAINYDTPEYVCIQEDYTENSILDHYNEMVSHINSKGIEIVEQNKENYSVTAKDNSVYTLGVNTTYVNNIKKETVASIISHASKCLFTTDSLYIDKSGDIVDILGRGVKDATNRFFKIRPGFDTSYTNDTKLLESIIRYVVKYNFHLEDIMEQIVYRRVPDAHNLNTKVIEHILSESKHNAYMFLRKYNKVKDYLSNRCGVQIEMFVKDYIGLPEGIIPPPDDCVEIPLPEDVVEVKQEYVKYYEKLVKDAGKIYLA